MEKLKRDKNRINISKLKETDLDENSISGGYIIKIDKSDMEDGSYTDYNSFKSNYDVFGNKNGDKLIFFNYDYPKPSDIHSDQKNYIQNYFHEFEDAHDCDVIMFRKDFRKIIQTISSATHDILAGS